MSEARNYARMHEHAHEMDTHNYAYRHISYQDIRQSDCHMLSQRSDA